MGKAIGIDLGTTNTAVAVLVDGRPRVLEDEKGYKVLPSCVAFKGDGERVVGQAARNLIITQPENTAYAVKRLMGRRFDSPEVAEVQRLVSYQIAAADDGLCKIRVGEDWYSPVQVSAFILQVAREMAERTLGEPVDEAVITVPAYFNHGQRSATFEAARLAGLRCERLLNEPTAAALAYGFRKDVERRIVVYDLGGGTFDVSVLQLSKGIYEVLATSGETHLGGEDFDQRIVDQLSDDFQAETGVDPRTDPTALQRLKDAAERAKCELSFTDRTTILIPMITISDSLETAISRLTLEGLVDDLIDRTLEITKSAIQSAGLRLGDIDDVILVGGQTRMPRVREAIRSLFQKEPSRSVHPEEVVAIGAAVHATSLTSRDIKQTVLLDVTPFDLGIDVAGGLFKRIISANSQVPASFTETFATARDNQQQVRVTVRQGASPMATENEFLGEFLMTGLSAAPRMETKVDVTFKIDTNGMLHASAMEQGSGERRRITIRNYAEFVQGEGNVAPVLEGDLGTPEEPGESSEGETANDAASSRSTASAKKSLFQRLFGRGKSSSHSGSIDGPSDPAAPMDAEHGLPEAPPEMPAFLQELGEDDFSAMEPLDELAVPANLDAVGGGLDALGFDDFAPLSASDLAPVPVAEDDALAEGALESEEQLFVLPDGEDLIDDALVEGATEEAAAAGGDDLEDGYLDDDDDDVFYDDEDLEDTAEAVFVDIEEDSPGGVYRGGAPRASTEDDDDVLSEAISIVDMASEPGRDLLSASSPTQEDATEESVLDGLLDSEDFEVDDSTRSVVEGIVAPEVMPLPASHVRDEDLWEDDDLPDDGTVEYTRDGATSTPRAAKWANAVRGDGELSEADTLVPLSGSGVPSASRPYTLVEASPSDFDDAPTDPPKAAKADHSRRMRMKYHEDRKLAEELTDGLRRGGCFVSTDSPLHVGTECVLEFSSPGLV
ncbi:MAG: hypothetical protein CL927_11175, partial [Deltaproteobacteria bacterium]|nr:hypothetical protein [Deltaproteobacteria bacterium]HCH64140.1 hypothetical protein [Deltaproteobacteria bacterium]